MEEQKSNVGNSENRGVETVVEKPSIEELRKVVIDSFPEYWLVTEACLATVATLLLKDNANPTSLALVGRVSAGKSTVLGFFKHVKDIVYHTDYFTPKAFVTHYADKNKETLKDIDLLKRITQKCLVVSDLGVIFSKRREDLAENLGILTRALDGDGLSTDSGVFGRRECVGDCMFAMLFGTTPLVYRVWDIMGRFGSRLLFLRMPEIEEDSEEMIAELQNGVTYRNKKEFCGVVVNKFLKSLWEATGGFRSVSWNNKGMPRETLRIISGLAKLLAKLRGIIPIWEDEDGNFQYRAPCIESPRRALALLLNIAKGRAIIYGREQINMEDMPLLFDIVLSSCPEDRGKIFRELLNRADGKLTTTEICDLLNVSPKSALKMMENLRVLKIVTCAEPEKYSAGRPEIAIKLTDEVRAWLP